MVYVGAQLFAQGGGAPQPAGGQPAAPPTLRTPVRIVNMSRVVKDYNRWKNFQHEYKMAYTKEYEEKVQGKKKMLEGYAAKLQDPKTPPAEKEEATKQGRKLEAEMKLISDEAKEKLGKMQADMFIKIYKEVEEATGQFARSAGVELVLFYSDATEEPDLHAMGNIERKLGNGAFMPLYAAPGMDISPNILNILNSRVPAVKTDVATPAGGTPPQPGAGGTPPRQPIVPVGGTQPGGTLPGGAPRPKN
jgi:Skp family chaperone for outer membrane proteins